MTWFQQVPYFRDEYTVVLFDSRGYGRSRCPPHAQQLRSRVDDLTAVLDAVGIERAALVGHSLGGYSVLPFALANADRAACIVLAGSPAGVRLPGHARAAKRLLARYQQGLRPQETFLSASFRDLHPSRSFLFDQINDANPPRPAYAGDISSWTVILEPSDVDSLTTPVLAIASAADPNYYVDEVAELAQVLGARMAVIDGVGHPAYFEDPTTFNRTVRDFLQSCGWA